MGNCTRKSVVEESIAPAEIIRTISVNPSSLINKSSVFDKYTIEKVLSIGQFGVVRQGWSSSLRKVIIKSINKDIMADNFSIVHCRQELEILLKVRHENIVEVIECFEDVSHFHLVTAYCDGTSLYYTLIEKTNFSEEVSASLTRCMLHSVSYLHSHEVHLNHLNPESFIIKGSSLKLVDFGIEKRFAMSTEKIFKKITGSSYFVAPEVLSGKRNNFKSDSWSIGVILYVMLSGSLPFVGDKVSIVRTVRNGDWDWNSYEWAKVSASAKNLISKLLVLDTDDRISCDEACRSEWLNSNNTNSSFSLFRLQKKWNKLQKEAIQAISIINNENQNVKSLASILANRLRPSKEAIHKAFGYFDVDGTGFITPENLVSALERQQKFVSIAEARQILEEAGARTHQNLSFFDFNQMMTLNCTGSDN